MTKKVFFSCWLWLALGFSTVMAQTLLLTVTVPGTDGSLFLVSAIPAEVTGSVTAKGFEHRLKGAGTWTIVSAAGVFEANIKGLPTGTHEVRAFAEVSGQGTLYSRTNIVMVVCDCGEPIINYNTCNASASGIIPAGVEINGVIWATRNVDMPGTFAETPLDAGMFYQWNRNIGWSSTDPMINSNGGTTWDNSFPPGALPINMPWIRANDPSPTGWRVPTRAEVQSLVNTEKVNYTMITVNGVVGGCFTDISTGNSIFLPAAGFRHQDGWLQNFEVAGFWHGKYWTGLSTDGNGGRDFSVYDSGASIFWSFTRNGQNVRSVAE